MAKQTYDKREDEDTFSHTINDRRLVAWMKKHGAPMEYASNFCLEKGMGERLEIIPDEETGAVEFRWFVPKR